MKGAVWAVLGLTLLQALLSNRSNATRLGELGTAVGAVLSHVIDPDVPAIPDRRASTTSGPVIVPATAVRPAAAVAPAPLPTLSPNSSSQYVTA